MGLVPHMFKGWWCSTTKDTCSQAARSCMLRHAGGDSPTNDTYVHRLVGVVPPRTCMLRQAGGGSPTMDTYGGSPTKDTGWWG